MRVLFTHSYFLKFDPKQWNIMQPYAPLGTLYAAAFLRASGYDVALHDVMFADDPESLQPVLDSYKPDILVLYDDGFNYLTKMCLTNMREAAFTMAAMAKAYGCKVVISSSDSTDHYDKYLDNNADYVMLGEAEHTLLELVDALDSNKPINNIAGLAMRIDGTTVRTQVRPVIKDLDALPDAAWDLVDIQKYKAAWLQSTGYFSINMGTTRGCPFKCNWCAKPIYGNRYNARSAARVVAELKNLQQQFGFDHVWFCDDIFGLKPGWVKQFATRCKQEGVQIKFKIQSRADLLLEDSQVEDLAAAGCEIVWMGAESGSQRILDAMDKGTTVEQIATATRMLKKHNIKTAFFLQFGYLGETFEDIQQTLAMIEELVPADLGISVSYPLPGTKFFDKVKQQLGNKTNWTDSDELALMFVNTYKPEFYKQLHRYVHAFYRKLVAKEKLKLMVASKITVNLRDVYTIVKMPYYMLRAMQQKRKLDKTIG